MALAYIEKLDGYIADTPNIDFLRCDGTAFSFYECQSGNFTDTLNFLTVTGGWGTTPLAYIPTDRTTEFQFESAQFSIDIFAMANAVETKSGDFGTLETDNFDVEATTTGEGQSATTTYTITMPFEVMAGSVRIRGLVEDTTLAAGKFTVAITPYSPAGGTDQAPVAEVKAKTVITFHADDVKAGDTIRVTYRRRVVNAVASVRSLPQKPRSISHRNLMCGNASARPPIVRSSSPQPSMFTCFRFGSCVSVYFSVSTSVIGVFDRSSSSVASV